MCILIYVYFNVLLKVCYFHLGPLATDWNSWNACNTTCGTGFRYRIRQCYKPPCLPSVDLNETGTCTASCGGKWNIKVFNPTLILSWFIGCLRSAMNTPNNFTRMN